MWSGGREMDEAVRWESLDQEELVWLENRKEEELLWCEKNKKEELVWWEKAETDWKKMEYGEGLVWREMMGKDRKQQCQRFLETHQRWWVTFLSQDGRFQQRNDVDQQKQHQQSEKAES